MENKQQLVILPGWGGTKQSWKAFCEKAEADFEVFCLEMPCFGENPCPKEAWGVDEYADWVKNEISGLEKPVILGHSFGGQVAVNLISRHREICSKLVLSGAAAIRTDKKVKKMILAGIAKMGKFFLKMPVLNKLESLAKKVLYKAVDSPDYNETSGVQREIFKKIIGQSQKEKLPLIKVPTLVVWGSNDTYVPLKEGKMIASMIDGAKLEVIEGGRHGLHISETEKLLNIVKEFVFEE